MQETFSRAKSMSQASPDSKTSPRIESDSMRGIEVRADVIGACRRSALCCISDIGFDAMPREMIRALGISKIDNNLLHHFHGA
jgi:hypothetical protein